MTETYVLRSYHAYERIISPWYKSRFFPRQGDEPLLNTVIFILFFSFSACSASKASLNLAPPSTRTLTVSQLVPYSQTVHGGGIFHGTKTKKKDVRAERLICATYIFGIAIRNIESMFNGGVDEASTSYFVKRLVELY